MDISKIELLNKLIDSAEILADGSLFLRLKNGLEFYGEYSPFPFKKYIKGDLQKIDKIIGGSDYGSFYHILKEIFLENEYERHYRLKKGDIVVDAGASVGLFTIKAAKEVGPKGKIIAIEPENTHLKFLKRNIKANHLKNVIIVPKGLWSKKGKRKLYLYDNVGAHSLYSDKDFPKLWKLIGVVTAEVDTIDNILKELGLKRIDFIKMDIEGAEIEALKGAKGTLQNNNVKLAIGAYHELYGKPTYKALIPQLKELGFKTKLKNEHVYASK